MSALVSCDATGLVTISMGTRCPAGNLPVFYADTIARAREVAEAVCRHGYPESCLIVAGVRDAFPRGLCAIEALDDFREWIEDGEREGIWI